MTITAQLAADACRRCGRAKSTHGGERHIGRCPDGHGRYSTPGRVQTGLPGNGPWAILADCPSEVHNTTYAGEGRGGFPRCVCPRGLALHRKRKNQWSERRNERRRELRRIKARGEAKDFPTQVKGNKLRLALAGSVDELQPSFEGGLCTLPINRESVDKGFSLEDSPGGRALRLEAKRICYACPLRETVCEPYVLRAEYPAGSWGGVWGGLDPQQRKQRARAKS